MATEQPGFSVGTQTAAADLSTHQFKTVKPGAAAGQVALSTVAGAAIFGILQDTPTLGQPANVMVMGVSKAKSGAAVATAVRVMTGADGRIITAATTGSTCIGWSLEAAGAADVFFSILLFPAGII